MPSPDHYFEAFSNYLASGDVSTLLPYLEPDANPSYLHIYRNGAIKSALDALASNFPTLKQVLGDDVFNTLARNYVLSHWPSDSCLSTYGDKFAAFVSNSDICLVANSADFAKLDRAWLDALFALDEAPLSGDELASLIADESDQPVRINIVSSVNIVRLETDCLHQWIALKFDSEIEIEEQHSKSVMLWRNELAVHYRQLSEFDEAFIKAVADSTSIITAAETALTIDPTGDISHLFAALITAGILTKNKAPAKAVSSELKEKAK